MPKFNDNELATLNQLAEQQQGNNATTSPGHLIVQVMSNDRVSAQGDVGGGNFTADAVRKLNGAGHNWEDAEKAMAMVNKLHPAHSTEADLAKANEQLDNYVIVDAHIAPSKGWSAGW